ncbi:MAG: 5-formyltetrahydrofolate cyclo-ligase [Clostridia bacterium]|nr:5-formyltetrahydrofolate cyclo-ligase [Clostridia bacterium]
MLSARDEKRELRKQCAAIRDGIAPAEKQSADQRINRLFLSLSSYRFSQLVLLYSPIKSEIDVRPIMEATLACGKKLALPLCEEEPGVMTFRMIEDLGMLQKGTFGVMEPPKDAPLCPKELLLDEHAILAVPALAFDKHGFRLGYGKGYYDRFLADFKGTSVGLVYRRLLVDRLPKGYYDRKVGLLISESGVMLPDD